jgi:hypothetical protein
MEKWYVQSGAAAPLAFLLIVETFLDIDISSTAAAVQKKYIVVSHMPLVILDYFEYNGSPAAPFDKKSLELRNYFISVITTWTIIFLTNDHQQDFNVNLLNEDYFHQSAAAPSQGKE